MKQELAEQIAFYTSISTALETFKHIAESYQSSFFLKDKSPTQLNTFNTYIASQEHYQSLSKGEYAIHISALKATYAHLQRFTEVMLEMHLQNRPDLKSE